MAQNVALVTNFTPYKLLVAPMSAADARWYPQVLSATALSGGSWQHRATHNVAQVTKLFGGVGVNAVTLLPWAESTKPGSSIKFRVDVYRGLNAPAERVYAGSAILGGYLISAQPYMGVPGDSPIAVTTSGRLFDEITGGTDYWNGVTLQDAAGNNGGARLWFDLHGAEFIAFNVTGGGTGAGRIGCAIAGW